MVAIMIICSHIPELRGVAVLLSREGLPDTESDLPDMPRGHEDDAPTSGTRNSAAPNDNQTAAAGEEPPALGPSGHVP